MSACVLCGVDDSRGAREAVRVAARLSEQLGLRLVLIHVASPSRHLSSRGMASGSGETQEGQLEAAGRALRDIAQEYELDGRAEQRLEVGDPIERLAEVADEQGAAMLVVGSRGRGALKAALLGSVSSGLAAKAQCPVVVVPPELARVEGDGPR